MEKIVSRSNLVAALARVVSNKGAPGIDAMPVTALRDTSSRMAAHQGRTAGRAVPAAAGPTGEIPKESGARGC